MSNSLLTELSSKGMVSLKPKKPCISVGLGTCGIGNGADELYKALQSLAGKDVIIKRAGCFGFCAEEPLLMLYQSGKPILLFTQVQGKSAKKYIQAALDPRACERLAKTARAKISRWDFRTSKLDFGEGYPKVPEWNQIPFFKGQEKLVLRDCGLIDPESLDEYAAVGGYKALAKAVGSLKPNDVIDMVSAAKLRGRGGAGFPTGIKWKLMAQNQGSEKWVICNADEGDP
ncbi:MAG TPA: proton-conducting membrane transporter, partial [Spirochaetales bacterium]|nr:proton-conducting membrane transporter [Spirochaetales bacterium]